MLLWRSGPLYWAYARISGREMPPHASDFDYWVAGFPRSSNTFTARSLQALVNAGKVAERIHSAPVVLNLLHSGKPGIFVTRTPRAAVLSWAIYSGHPLPDILDDYIDFHRFLLPYRSSLFVADFSATTTALEDVMKRFAEQFNVRLKPAPVGAAFCRERLEEISGSWTNQDGSPNELQAPRPSKVRADIARDREGEFEGSPRLRDGLKLAEEIHRAFVPDVAE
jgi:hypothetical protein